MMSRIKRCVLMAGNSITSSHAEEVSSVSLPLTVFSSSLWLCIWPTS